MAKKFSFELSDQEFNNLKSLFSTVQKSIDSRILAAKGDEQLLETLKQIKELDTALEKKIMAGVMNEENIPAIPVDTKKGITLYDGCAVELKDGSIVQLQQIREPAYWTWCFKMTDDHILHDWSYQLFDVNGRGYHDMDVVGFAELPKNY